MDLKLTAWFCERLAGKAGPECCGIGSRILQEIKGAKSASSRLRIGSGVSHRTTAFAQFGSLLASPPADPRSVAMCRSVTPGMP